LANEVHVYRMAWWQRVVMIVLLAIAGGYLFRTWRPALDGSGAEKPNEMLLAVVLFAAAIVAAGAVWYARVTLSAFAISTRGLLRERSLPLDAVRGRREYVVRDYETGDTKYFRIEPNDDRLPVLKFQQSYTFDDAFYAWFYSLPDLDELDKKRTKDSSFGLI
jgi:hypothetical protein